ncbi:unnamed protein product, partial [Protopolystoma xenopodis]
MRSTVPGQNVSSSYSSYVILDGIPLPPSAPKSFEVLNITATSASISWKSPASQNGVSSGYHVMVTPNMPSKFTKIQNITVGAKLKKFLITDLAPCNEYNISLAGITKPDSENAGGGEGMALELTITTSTAGKLP